MHGSELASDMTIPIIIKCNMPRQASKKIKNATILDVAPTVVKLMNIDPDNDWKGQSLVC